MFQVCLNWLPLLYKRVDWKVLPPTPFSCSLGVQLNYRLSHSRILIFSANFWLSGEMCTVRLQSLSCKSVGFVISIRKMQILREATIAIHLFLIFFLPKNMLGTPEKEREQDVFRVDVSAVACRVHRGKLVETNGRWNMSAVIFLSLVGIFGHVYAVHILCTFWLELLSHFTF